MVGPAIGGLIVATGGTVAALLANSGVFAVTALTLATASGIPGAAPDEHPSAGRLRAALVHAARRPAIRVLLGLQAVALVFFTISIPVEVVFAQHTLHAGAGGYGGLLAAWGGGAIAGSAIYARWRAWQPRAMISLGAGSLAVGFAVMAAAPNLVVALIGAAVGGCGNGVEAVAARTTLQEHVEERWMAMMMSLNESLFQAVPGIGIIVGGALAALAGPRVALGVAAGGAALVTLVAWVLLEPGGALKEEPSPRSEGDEQTTRPTPSPVGRS
jgi:MFS family permease